MFFPTGKETGGDKFCSQFVISFLACMTTDIVVSKQPQARELNVLSFQELSAFMVWDTMAN
jgi:hypothetical protein